MGWRSRSLSWVGRCTLINSVVQTISNYTMSSFKILAKNCDKLDSLTRRFWWKPKENEGGFIAWKAWEKLCRPKCGSSWVQENKRCKCCLIGKACLDSIVKEGNHLYGFVESQIQIQP